MQHTSEQPHQNHSAAVMSKGEREDLQRLIRQREKVLTSAAKQRSAELLADFENQMGARVRFRPGRSLGTGDQSAEREVAKAQKLVAARCRKLGIPDQFAPSLELAWHHRGYGNLVARRRAELRTMAKSRIEAIERKAITDIEVNCLAAREQIALAGLTSAAA